MIDPERRGSGHIGIVAARSMRGGWTTLSVPRDRFVLVVSKDHPLARRHKVIRRRARHDFVGL